MLVVKRVSVVLVALIILGAIAATPFLWRDYGWYVAFQPGLKTLDGTPVDSPVDMFPENAKVGLVVYFMTGCDGCAKELQALGQVGRLDGLVGTLAVNVRGSLLDVQSFIKNNEIQVAGNNPILLGSDGTAIADEEGGIQVPYTLLVVKRGDNWVPIDGMVGALNQEQLETLAYYALLAEGEMPLNSLRHLLAEGNASDFLLETLKTDFFSMPVFNALLETNNITFEEIGALIAEGKLAYFDGALIPVMWSYNQDYQMFVVSVSRALPDNMGALETWEFFNGLYKLSLLNEEYTGALFVVFYTAGEGNLPLMTLCAYTTSERMISSPDVAGLADEALWQLMGEAWGIMTYDWFYALTWQYPYIYDMESPWAFAFIAAANAGESWAFDLQPSLVRFYDTAEAWAEQEGAGE